MSIGNIAQIRENSGIDFCSNCLLTKSARYDIMEVLPALIMGGQVIKPPRLEGRLLLLGVDLYHSVLGEEAEDASHSPQLVNHDTLASSGRGKHSAIRVGIGDLENQILGIA
jgi:hypothetical protein